MASCRQGHRTAGRLPGIRGVPLRILLRRGRGAAPGQRLLRGVRGLGGARRPPGGRLPAIAGRREYLAHVPRRTGPHPRPAVRDGRDLPEHRPPPRADAAAGAGRAGQHRPGLRRRAARALPLPPEPSRTAHPGRAGRPGNLAAALHRRARARLAAPPRRRLPRYVHDRRGRRDARAGDPDPRRPQWLGRPPSQPARIRRPERGRHSGAGHGGRQPCRVADLDRWRRNVQRTRCLVRGGWCAVSQV